MRYVVQFAHGTACPKCGSDDVSMLVREDGKIDSRTAPAFYVCGDLEETDGPPCGYIGQIGVGPVERVS